MLRALLVVLFVLFAGPALAQQSLCGVRVLENGGPISSSAIDANGPVIFYNSAYFDGPVGANFLRFQLAHECGHHMNGDVARAMQDPASTAARLKSIELNADCLAARLLVKAGDVIPLQTATTKFTAVGDKPTNAGFPTGLERAAEITRCTADMG